MSSSQALRAVLVVVAILLGVIAGLITVILTRASGATFTNATLRGGVATGSTITVVLLIMTALGAF